MNKSRSNAINSSVLRNCFSIYLGLSLFEFALNTGTGSILKYFGYFIIALWLILVLRQDKVIVIGSTTMWVIIWWIMMVVSFIWSQNKETGFYYIYSIANVICMIVVSQNMYWSVRDVDSFLNVYVLAAAFFSLFVAVKGNFYHDVGIRYTLLLLGQEMDPNGIAAYLVPPSLMCIFFVLKREKLWTVYLAVFFVCAYAVFLTGSRGGLLSFAFGVVVLLFLYSKWNDPSAFKLLRIVVILLIAGGGVYYILTHYVSNDIFQRLFMFETYTKDRGSDRVDLWIAAISYYKASPFWGIGLSSYIAITGRGIHNMYIDTLCDGGMLTFVPFVVMLIKILTTHIKQKRSIGVAITCAMMLTIFFLDAYQKKFMWNIIIIGIILQKFAVKKDGTDALSGFGE